MNYADNRDAEQLRLLTPAVDAFIAQYLNPPATASTCPRQTVFFFPGGMASQLVRANLPFQEGVATAQAFNYDIVWLDEDILVSDWRYLKMHSDSAGVFRDADDRFVVADGSAVNALGYMPYADFTNWCASINADVFVFGWDWRRRLDETAAFFVGKFLPFFRTRTMNAGCPDPLASYSVVGHSLGGMVVNLILRGDDPLTASMKSAITVATPFYGYAGQVHRWFEGDPTLLEIWADTLGDTVAWFLKQELVEVISSMPGLYVLHFLDQATFGATGIGPSLNGDAEFPLAGYPSQDQANPAQPADPYNPTSNGVLVRFPANTGFDLAELEYAEVQFKQLASAMSPAQSMKFHNIRGVTTLADAQTPVDNTVGSVTWGWIRSVFDARFDASPIVDGPLVPGDGTQPAWSARLVTNAQARWYTVRGTDVEHMVLMDHPQTRTAIEAILCAPAAANPPTASPRATDPASRKDVNRFLRWLMKHRKRWRRWPHLDDRAKARLLPPEFRKTRKAIGRRILEDLMRGPVTRAKSRAPGKKKPPARRRPRKPAKTR